MFKKRLSQLFLISLFGFWLSFSPVLAADPFAEEVATIKTIQAINRSTVSIAVYREVDSFNLATGEVIKRKTEIGQGTGFIVSANGLIVTNRHVINRDGELKVFLFSGQPYPAEVVAVDSVDDLALLKIEATKLPAAVLGDSDKIQIGQTVVALGNALGRYQNSATRGIVSGLSRSLVATDGEGRTENLEDVIQTDAAINLGNSGGPLVNLRCQVIGVNVAIETSAQSIGFALPINEVKRIVESYQKFGKIRRSFLGVRYQMIDAALQEEYGLTQNEGAFIVRDARTDASAVVAGSAAAQAGLLEGDIVIAVNNQSLTKNKSLRRVLMDFWPGTTVTLKIKRSGQIFSQVVILDEYPAQD